MNTLKLLNKFNNNYKTFSTLAKISSSSSLKVKGINTFSFNCFFSKIKTTSKSSALFKITRKNYETELNYVRKNSKIFMDVEINGNPEGRLIFEIYSEKVPQTSLNFIKFIEGFNLGSKNYTYKDTEFHKIIPGMLIQGGQVSENNDISSYGGRFPDENYLFSHEKTGALSMVNDGPNSNGSQFFITTSDCSW